MSETVLVSSLVALYKQASASSPFHSYPYSLHYVAIALFVCGFPVGVVLETTSW